MIYVQYQDSVTAQEAVYCFIPSDMQRVCSSHAVADKKVHNGFCLKKKKKKTFSPNSSPVFPNKNSAHLTATQAVKISKKVQLPAFVNHQFHQWS